jgi:oxygen-dependent protoporphyrinogen oxidase
MPQEAVAQWFALLDRYCAAVDYAGDWTSLRPCSEGAVTSAFTAAERTAAFLAQTREPIPIEA